MSRNPNPTPSRRSSVTAREFGDKVRRLREEREWSQSGLETAIDATKGSMSRIEVGDAKNVKPEVIARLADIFDISADDLLRDDREVA